MGRGFAGGGAVLAASATTFLSRFLSGRLSCFLSLTGFTDLSAIGFSIERYRALANGYFRGAADLVDADLRAALGAVPAYMAYMLGLRFLIDYLDGDTYFRVAHPEHNLARARSQFRLFQLMVDARAELDRIARKA